MISLIIDVSLGQSANAHRRKQLSLS